MRLPTSGSENRKRKAYYLADVMQFALPFIKTAAPASLENLPEVDLHEKHNAQATCQHASEALSDDDGCEDREHDNRSETKSPPFTQPLLPPLPPPPSPISSAKPSTSTCTPAQFVDKESLKNESSPQKHYKKKMTQKAEIEAVSMYTHFKAKKARLDTSPNQRCSEDERKEALKMFLLSLMPELVHFSEAQLKLFKRRVFGLIDEIELMETSATASARMFPQPSVSSMPSSSTSPSLVVAHKSPILEQNYEKFPHFLNPNEFTTNSV